MNPPKLSPDDPRLTAYALGELEPAECAEIERRLQADAEARAAVEEIRATANVLGAALRDEPPPAAEPVEFPGRRSEYPEVQRSRLLRFPQLYFVISGLAAACFAVFFAWHESREAVRAEAQARNSVVMTAARDRTESTAMGGLDANLPAAKKAAAPASLPLVPAEAAVADRFFPTADAASSAFPLRVGRASYDAVRALLRKGIRPARDTVQVAEMINAFAYTWPEPSPGEAFASVLEETDAPWAPGHRLVRIGLKARSGQGAPPADDARVEVDFNPARVQAWRLVGFERDGEAAGVQGAEGETLPPGNAVTVLYELVPVAKVALDADRNLLRLALTYREPGSLETQMFERTLPAGGTPFAGASPDMKFATAVAAFGLRLRNSTAQTPVALGEIAEWARAGGGAAGRPEFVGLVRAAEPMLR